MALHGEIGVNGHIIASWSARRLDHMMSIWDEYDYIAEYVPEHGNIMRAVITHQYVDGAGVLASKVLQLAEGGWEHSLNEGDAHVNLEIYA